MISTTEVCATIQRAELVRYTPKMRSAPLNRAITLQEARTFEWPDGKRLEVTFGWGTGAQGWATVKGVYQGQLAPIDEPLKWLGAYAILETAEESGPLRAWFIRLSKVSPLDSQLRETASCLSDRNLMTDEVYWTAYPDWAAFDECTEATE
ncbi:MAG: hypothetical protein ACU0DW_00505 [Shimia sp.]